MATQQVVNYNESAVEQLIRGYNPEATDEQRDVQIAALADVLGKSLPSIRAKLTHLGVYRPKYKVPAGKAGITKATHALFDKMREEFGWEVTYQPIEEDGNEWFNRYADLGLLPKFFTRICRKG